MVRKAVENHRFLRRLLSSAPLTIAHRGDSYRVPENTLEAAKHAHEQHADAWELDVHVTRDGVPVVIHDESLLRTTDVAVKFANDSRRHTGFLVADFDLREIQTLDAGSWFLDADSRPRSAASFGTLDRISDAQRKSYRSGTVRVPTLVQALDLTLGLDWLVNVELKSVPTSNPKLAELAVELIRERAMADRVLVSSFDHDEVARVVRLLPEVAAGVLTTTPLYRPHRYVKEWVGADCYHPSTDSVGAGSDRYRRDPSARTLRVEDLSALKDAEVPVCVYTVNDHRPGGLSDHLAEAGVAGLFTDDPAGLVGKKGRH